MRLTPARGGQFAPARDDQSLRFLQVSEITSGLKAVYFNAQAVLQNYMNMKELAADPSLSESTFLLIKAGEISFPEYLWEVQFIFENQLNFLEVERDYFVLLNKINLLTGY